MRGRSRSPFAASARRPMPSRDRLAVGRRDPAPNRLWFDADPRSRPPNRSWFAADSVRPVADRQRFAADPARPTVNHDRLAADPPNRSPNHDRLAADHEARRRTCIGSPPSTATSGSPRRTRSLSAASSRLRRVRLDHFGCNSIFGRARPRTALRAWCSEDARKPLFGIQLGPGHVATGVHQICVVGAPGRVRPASNVACGVACARVQQREQLRGLPR
jgi:hypothetical protein